jgi:hypothetical protein
LTTLAVPKNGEFRIIADRRVNTGLGVLQKSGAEIRGCLLPDRSGPGIIWTYSPLW